jgi:hypothetical protein
LRTFPIDEAQLLYQNWVPDAGLLASGFEAVKGSSVETLKPLLMNGGLEALKLTFHGLVEGYSALNFACRNVHVNSDMIEFLYHARPEAAATDDRRQNPTPLFRLFFANYVRNINSRAGEDCREVKKSIQFLFHATILSPNNKGCLPLSDPCHGRRNLQVDARYFNNQ